MDIDYLDTHQETKHIWSFHFTKPAGFHFEAGDYVELALNYPGKTGGGRRWYSIASSPHEHQLQFTTKITSRPSDFKKALLALKKGHKATISPPLGTFHLPLGRAQKILWIGGGVGVTPYRSMARWIRHQRQPRDINLLYVVRDHEYVFMDQVQAVATVILPDELTKLSQITTLVPDYTERIMYFSGAENFCMNLYDQLLASGIPIQQLKLDYFTGYNTL